MCHEREGILHDEVVDRYGRVQGNRSRMLQEDFRRQDDAQERRVLRGRITQGGPAVFGPQEDVDGRQGRHCRPD